MVESMDDEAAHLAQCETETEAEAEAEAEAEEEDAKTRNFEKEDAKTRDFELLQVVQALREGLDIARKRAGLAAQVRRIRMRAYADVC
jgi:FKBP-type peptidyl-prolyl cis-trans isomerase